MGPMLTPMDFAMAGLAVWRRHAQNAAITGMRMGGLAGEWMRTPTEIMESASQAQAEFALATKKISLAMLEAAHGEGPARP